MTQSVELRCLNVSVHNNDRIFGNGIVGQVMQV
jgi:hypothetical protein